MSIINKIFKRPKTLKGAYQKYYSKKEWNIEIPEVSLYDYVVEQSKGKENLNALGYYGTKITYAQFIRQIDAAARAYRCQGIRAGDVVTICMPNTPEAVISFYALNKIGAISNMIHPLSGANEIKEYINSTKSVMLVMIDLVYDKIKDILGQTDIYKTIVVSAKDSMPFWLGIGYSITKGAAVKKPAASEAYIYWKEFLNKAKRYDGEVHTYHDSSAVAVILHSGGTTGTPKGILLTNRNVNAEAVQIVNKLTIEPGLSILTIMPVFHGFGLVLSIHAPLCLGLEVNLLPTFDPKNFDKVVMKNKPNFIVGVPTLFEAFLNNADRMKNEDLSFVKYCVVGGDTMSLPQQRRMNVFMAEHGSKAKMIVGYGMTESVAATIATLGGPDREGAIGIPLAGMHVKIVDPATREEVETGQDGEICVSGPTVMAGYLDNEKETNEVLQIHDDGHIWLHTGDIGAMDSDGVIYYRQRLKRMIISSGYNVYPQQIEKVIEEHEAVLQCTVIGVAHPYKVQVAKAYIVLKNDYKETGALRRSIKEHCEQNLAAYAIPKDFDFRQSLPKTLLGKVDYRELERENVKE